MKTTWNRKRTLTTLVRPIALLLVFGGLQVNAENAQDCSAASLTGTYGFQISGGIPGVMAISGVSRLSFDGQGNFTQIGDSQILINGQPPIVVVGQSGSGTYTVNPDCTGAETLTVGGKVHHSTFVLVDHGKEVLDMNVDPGVVLTGVGKKQ